MCIELLLASADTSSVTLYYTLVLLAQKPELKEALIEEIQAVKVGIGNHFALWRKDLGTSKIRWH